MNDTKTATHGSTPRRTLPPSAKSYEMFMVESLPAGGKTTFASILDTLATAVFCDASAPLLHNTSYWTTFFNSLIAEISGGLCIRSGYERSEAEVKHELIAPFLKRIAHAVSAVVAPSGWEGGSEFTSLLNVESKTEERRHTRGAKPRVDYTLCGHVGGEAVYHVPVEVKKNMTVKDMPQLAQYMATLGRSGKYTEENVCIGFLIDEFYVRVVFAPLSLPDGRPLPIVFFGHLTRWRESTVINRGVCVALCFLQKLNMKRIVISPASIEEMFGEKSRAITAAARDHCKRRSCCWNSSRSAVRLHKRGRVTKQEVRDLKAQLAAHGFLTPRKRPCLEE